MSFWDRLGQKLSKVVDGLDEVLTVPDAVREQLERGQRALEGGDAAEAEALLRQAADAVPEWGRAHYLLGLSQLRQDKVAPAIASLELARKRDGDSFPVLLALAEARRAAGDTDAALKSYRQALVCRVDERLLGRAYGGIGEIYLERGQHDRAVRELRKAVAVSEGQDLQLVGLLGLAQLGDGDLPLARHSLSRAAAAPVPERQVLLSLAHVLLELGQHGEARLAALRLLQERPDDAEGRCALARCHLAAGERTEAHQELLRALEIDPGLFEAHRLLAQVHLAAHDPSAALRHLRVALTLDAPSPSAQQQARRQLLEIELEAAVDAAELPRELGADAAALLAAEPDDPLALASLALASLRQPFRARELVGRSLASRETYAGRLAEGLVLLRGKGDLEGAATALRAAVRLRPDGRARALLAQVYDAQAGPLGEAAALDFYPALQRIHRLLLPQPRVVELATEVARIQEIFDRPLLITVMGEFNSGKSTFVNALIGEKVAPMGVTPTTATINILKYGERRGARVVWRDDREDRLEWEAVGPFLRGLDRERARQVRIVEILFPSEELLRVNVVDTPGLNSMIDEHEQTAREYMSQADAVIWLFSAGQAGKQTEQQALEILRQHRLKTVGVLNKIDALSPEDLERVHAYLQQEFAELVDAVIPVAARDALEAMVSGGELGPSRFPELRVHLEEQLFARSRRIKREVCQRRLDEVLEQVTARMNQALAQADRGIEQVDQLRRQLQETRAEPELVEQERLELRQALQAVYRQGAAEVLDFVRPRRWVFGQHKATAADRDFLLELLMDGLSKMGEASAARVADHLDQVAGQLRQGLTALGSEALSALAGSSETLDRLTQDRLALMHQQVYARYAAFARGVLQGGRVDDFFGEKLPRIELEQDAICRALLADSVDLEPELLAPLADWYDATLELLLQQLARLRAELDLVRLEGDRTLVAPVLEIQRALARGDAAAEHEPMTDEGP